MSDQPPAPSAASIKVARYATIILAGLFGMCHMLWIWRMELGVPVVLSVAVHMSDDGSPVRPWAPWWVPVSIMAIFAMLLWRGLALRRERIRFGRGALAFALIVLLGYPTAFLCLELGATAQFHPWPSLERFLTVLPLMVAGSIGTAIMLMFAMGGIILAPVAALFGVANAAVGRIILRIGRRRSAKPASERAGHFGAASQVSDTVFHTGPAGSPVAARARGD